MGIMDWLLSKLIDPAPSSSPGCEKTLAHSGVAVVDAPAESDSDDAGTPWWAPPDAALTEPVQIERPELCTEARALENLLISHFDGHNLTLPPMMHMAEAILPLLSNRNYSMASVSEKLSEDQVIAAAVLRMTNSPLYRGLEKITAIQPAITRLGTVALRTLLLNESLRAATFFSNREDTGAFARMIWQQSLASATIMRGLSAFTSVDREEAFLIGLLHDIGNVVVLRISCGGHGAAHYEIDLGTFEYLCHETHQEFGELLADAWRLPEKIKSLMVDHHRSPASDDPLHIERLQLQLTDMITAMIGYSAPASYDLLGSVPVSELNLAERAGFIEYLRGLPVEVEEIVQAL